MNNEDEKTIQLLAEKLVVSRENKKVGEVVVRKETETKLVEVQVPVKQEKLIVEQLGDDPKQLAEIDLGETTVIASEPNSLSNPEDDCTVGGEFYSLAAARDLLAAIALQKENGCVKVRLELVLENPELKDSYQTMVNSFAPGVSLANSETVNTDRAETSGEW